MSFINHTYKHTQTQTQTHTHTHTPCTHRNVSCDSTHISSVVVEGAFCSVVPFSIPVMYTKFSGYNFVLAQDSLFFSIVRLMDTASPHVLHAPLPELPIVLSFIILTRVINMIACFHKYDVLKE